MATAAAAFLFRGYSDGFDQQQSQSAVLVAAQSIDAEDTKILQMLKLCLYAKNVMHRTRGYMLLLPVVGAYDDQLFITSCQRQGWIQSRQSAEREREKKTVAECIIWTVASTHPTTKRTENNTATYSIKEARAFSLSLSLCLSAEGVGNGRELTRCITSFSPFLVVFNS